MTATEEVPAAVERAAAAYLHMVPHCAGCAKESKGLLRRCAACKNLALEFAFHMLGAAFDAAAMGRAVADALYGQNVTTLVMRRPGESRRDQAERIGGWAAGVMNETTLREPTKDTP